MILCINRETSNDNHQANHYRKFWNSFHCSLSLFCSYIPFLFSGSFFLFLHLYLLQFNLSQISSAISSRVVFGLLALKYIQLLLWFSFLPLLKKDLNLQCMIVQKCKIKLYKVFFISHFLSLQLERQFLVFIFRDYC